MNRTQQKIMRSDNKNMTNQNQTKPNQTEPKPLFELGTVLIVLA